MEVAGPLGTPLGLAQRKRASPRGEAGTSGFLSVSDIREPLVRRQGSQVSMRVAREATSRISSLDWCHPEVRHEDWERLPDKAGESTILSRSGGVKATEQQHTHFKVWWMDL